MNLEYAAFLLTVTLYLFGVAGYFVFLALKKEKASVWAYRFMLAGFAVHTVCLTARGINAGRLPLTNQYEFALAFAWGIVLCFLIFVKKYDFNALGCFVAPVVFLVIGYAAMQSKEVRELMPALRSNCFVSRRSSSSATAKAMTVGLPGR